MNEIAEVLAAIRGRAGISQAELAQMIGTSLASIVKWEDGATGPSPAQAQKIRALYADLLSGIPPSRFKKAQRVFASSGARQKPLPLFDKTYDAGFSDEPLSPILARLSADRRFWGLEGENRLRQMLQKHASAAAVASAPPSSGMSAGKNTYTYDAHTYHTKVPPQGIAELLKHYLPEGGLILDPFAGSGMTGVAAQVLGYSCILNELSPAACFIANRFTTAIEPGLFRAGVEKVLAATGDIRKSLYATRHRRKGATIEFEYVVWSYKVICNYCGHEFILWDRCRKYGNSPREHKILSVFPCPECGQTLKKSALRRTNTEPVMVAYRDGNTIAHCPLEEDDRQILERLRTDPLLAQGYFPQTRLYRGVNLRQPMKHGLERIDQFYTPRNLAAMSHLWRAIHRIEDPELAGFLAFAFTSLYQRVTRLAEFRFWGGSGNLARYNVPFIFKEANVFTTFERKARAIQDHLETAATHYSGEVLVVRNSATALSYLPDESIDLIFTDPPFGANIHYSEMNILWESWLGEFTDPADEAIINKYQRKGIDDYRALMTRILAECCRVLRRGRWMLLVFMNSSQEVWEALRAAITDAGFKICQVDIFDKQHSTFKQLVSDNTAGADLVLHCQKSPVLRASYPVEERARAKALRQSILAFLEAIDSERYVIHYLHVARGDETDFRTLYSEWLAQTIEQNGPTADFAVFRSIARRWLDNQSRKQ